MSQKRASAEGPDGRHAREDKGAQTGNRSAHLGLLAASAIASAFVSACDSTCESQADCTNQERCVDGACKPREVRPPPPRQDTGPLDFGPLRDLGTSTTSDGGPDGGLDGGDGSVLDGARPDGAMPDAGDPDSGPVDGGRAVRNLGQVTVGELVGSIGTTVVAEAAFSDRSAALFDEVVSMFNQGGVSCILRQERQTSGSVVGISAPQITISGLFINGAANGTITLREASAGSGIFSNAGAVIFPGIYVGVTNVNMEIQAGSNAGDLALHDSGPMIPNQGISFPQPDPSSTLSLSFPINLSWTVSAVAPGVVVEIYDGPKQVVLTCQALNSGSFMMPEAARLAFSAASPTQPYTLELRIDEDAVEPVSRVQRSDRVTTTFRLTRGVRYRMTP